MSTENHKPRYRAEYGDDRPWIFEGTADDCRSIARFDSTAKRDEFLRAVNAHEALVLQFFGKTVTDPLDRLRVFRARKEGRG